MKLVAMALRTAFATSVLVSCNKCRLKYIMEALFSSSRSKCRAKTDPLQGETRTID